MAISQEQAIEIIRQRAQQEDRSRLTARSTTPLTFDRWLHEDDVDYGQVLPVIVSGAAKDRELGLTNLTPAGQAWVRMQLRRVAIMLRNGRPRHAGSYKQEIVLAALDAKIFIKSSRSLNDGFERRQLTTSTSNVITTTNQPSAQSRPRFGWLHRGGGA